MDHDTERPGGDATPKKSLGKKPLIQKDQGLNNHTK